MSYQLLTYATKSGDRAGLLINGQVYDAAHASELVKGADASVWADAHKLIANWGTQNTLLEQAANIIAAGKAKLAGQPRSALTLRPPITPRNIYFAGANYKDHVAEMARTLGLPLDDDPRKANPRPWHAIKATGSTLRGDGDATPNPGSPMLDWEIELAVVIGATTKNISEADALNCVAGYTVANDLSAREHVSRPEVSPASPFKWDWTGQKSFDGACPLGPAIAPASAIADPMNLALKTWVNGELMQDSNTSQMIFNIAEQIAYLSTRITLLPGDVILTGTPAGVGMARKKFLKAGDTVKCWIDGIGELTTPIE
jgi:2-keto-4-pentenoate hydratase/2-oxohepta-3-ene-1,7-dioic acid hydratase in catechol pathway